MLSAYNALSKHLWRKEAANFALPKWINVNDVMDHHYALCALLDISYGMVYVVSAKDRIASHAYLKQYVLFVNQASIYQVGLVIIVQLYWVTAYLVIVLGALIVQTDSTVA